MKPINDKEHHIMIIDDAKNNLDLLDRILTKCGYQVYPVSSGVSALEQIEEIIPDLILLDIIMPQMDGYEVCRRIKADERTKDIPVIFISALEDELDKVKAFRLGGVDYITKPFSKEEVLMRVHTHLVLQSQRKQLQEEIDVRKKAEAALAEANEQLAYLVMIDGLTQVANRRRFDEYIEKEWQRCVRNHLPIGLIIADIDYFKRFNDHYRHQVGDECLKQVAQAIKKALKRPADMVARYGGEEFAVVLPNTDQSGAMHVSKLIQRNIDELKIPHSCSEVHDYLTISMGVSCAMPDPFNIYENLISAADEALYQAKANGRNRIVFNSLNCD